MRIFRFILLMFCLIGSAHAEYFSGLGLGVRLGVNFTRNTHSYATLTGTTRQSLTATGFGYYLVLDYMKEIGDSRFLLGIEGYVGNSHAQHSANLRNSSGVFEGKVNLKHRETFGGALKAGVMLNRKVAGFVGVGLESKRYVTNYSLLTFGTNPTPSYNKHATGYVFTTGGLYRWQNFKIGLGYAYVKFTSLNLRNLSDVVDGAQRGLRVRPHEHRIFLSLTYILFGPKKEEGF